MSGQWLVTTGYLWSMSGHEWLVIVNKWLLLLVSYGQWLDMNGYLLSMGGHKLSCMVNAGLVMVYPSDYTKGLYIRCVTKSIKLFERRPNK